jgi:hypothetical protein
MRRLRGCVPNPVSSGGAALSLERSARGGAAVPRRWKPRAEIAVAGQKQVEKSRCWDRWTGAVRLRATAPRIAHFEGVHSRHDIRRLVARAIALAVHVSVQYRDCPETNATHRAGRRLHAFEWDTNLQRNCGGLVPFIALS